MFWPTSRCRALCTADDRCVRRACERGHRGSIFAAGLRDLVSKNVRPIEKTDRFLATLGKKSRAPLSSSCRDGSARFFFSRVGFAMLSPVRFSGLRTGNSMTHLFCALSFGRSFSDVKSPRRWRGHALRGTRARTGDGRTSADSARSCRDRIARAARGFGGIARVRHASTDRPDV